MISLIVLGPETMQFYQSVFIVVSMAFLALAFAGFTILSYAAYKRRDGQTGILLAIAATVVLLLFLDGALSIVTRMLDVALQ